MRLLLLSAHLSAVRLAFGDVSASVPGHYKVGGTLPTCSATTEFVNSRSRVCEACPSGQMPNADGTACVCAPLSASGNPQMSCYPGQDCIKHPGATAVTTTSGIQCIECGCFDRSNSTASAYPDQVSGQSCTARGFEQMVATADQSRCLPCPSAAATLVSVSTSPARKDCNCGTNQAILEKSATGAYLTEKVCQACDSSLTVAAGQATCAASTACPSSTTTSGLCYTPASDWTGKANTAGTALSSFGVQSAKRVKFSAVIASPAKPEWWMTDAVGSLLGFQKTDSKAQEILTSGLASEATVDSATLDYLYQGCAIQCARKVNEGCECLSNLCALQMYHQDATVCQLLETWFYTDATNYPASDSSPGMYGTLPWIMFPAGGYTKTGLTLPESSPSFVVAKYSFEGRYLGEETVTNHLQLCDRFGGSAPGFEDDAKEYLWTKKNTVVQECRIPASTFLNHGLCQDPVLYDLFAVTSSGAKTPVPVRMLNTVRGSTKPNVNFAEDQFYVDGYSGFLAKRFFLCDSALGRTSDFLGMSDPAYVRYAAQVFLQLRVDSGSLQVPVLNIVYLESTVAGGKDASLPCIFKAEFSEDTAGFWSAVTVFLILTLILLLGLIYLRYRSIELRYPWESGFAADPGLFMGKSLLMLLTVVKISFGVLFWFHFFMVLYWVVSDAYLLPGSLDGDQYNHHDVMMTVLLVMASVVILLFLYKQASCFIFLIDREPKPLQDGASGGANKDQNGNKAQQNNPAGGADFDREHAPDKGISIWRSLFVGNELSERIAATRTSGYATWILMILFLQGFNWVDSCRWSGSEQSPFNPFLMYGVTGGTWLLSVAIQLVGRHLIAMREGLDLINFVDICSLANVSVFIMDEPHHGYYIHGRCPGGKGDCCATEMSYTLDEEARGLLPKRGLTPDHPSRGELQTFEVFTPGGFKEQLFGLYRQILAERGVPGMFASHWHGEHDQFGGHHMGMHFPGHLGGGQHQMGIGQTPRGSQMLGQQQLGGMDPMSSGRQSQLMNSMGGQPQQQFGGSSGSNNSTFGQQQQQNAFGQQQQQSFGAQPGSAFGQQQQQPQAFGQQSSFGQQPQAFGTPGSAFGGGFEGAHRAEIPAPTPTCRFEQKGGSSSSTFYRSSSRSTFGTTSTGRRAAAPWYHPGNWLPGRKRSRFFSGGVDARGFSAPPATVLTGSNIAANANTCAAGTTMLNHELHAQTDTVISPAYQVDELQHGNFSSVRNPHARPRIRDEGEMTGGVESPVGVDVAELDSSPELLPSRSGEDETGSSCQLVWSHTAKSEIIELERILHQADLQHDEPAANNEDTHEEGQYDRRSSHVEKKRKISDEKVAIVEASANGVEPRTAAGELIDYELPQPEDLHVVGSTKTDEDHLHHDQHLQVEGAHSMMMDNNNRNSGMNQFQGSLNLGNLNNQGMMPQNSGRGSQMSAFGGQNTMSMSGGPRPSQGSMQIGSQQSMPNAFGGGNQMQNSMMLGGGNAMHNQFNPGGMGASMSMGGGLGGGASSSVRKLAQLRYQMQEMLLQLVDGVVRDQSMCIKEEMGSMFGATPDVSVPTFPPTFYEDPSHLRWTNAMAYGPELLGVPTGFEWQVLVLEYLIFAVCFRFSENLWLGIFLGFLVGQLVLSVRASLGESRLADTAMIDHRFLL
ncbi:unnamed protein product [Amoebophrya sp. A120]|nr:unnamed protein product [Amoebophrya sp. A120]|eukprot:GSA120T00020879001.1